MNDTVRTGAFVYEQWMQETTFGTEVSPKNRTFGLDEKISPISTINNQQALSQLYSVETSKFAYGLNGKTYSMDWVLSDPWFLILLFGSLITTGTSPYTHTYSVIKTVQSFSHEIAFEAETANVVRKLLGSVLNTVTIRSAINELARVSGSFICGKEAAVGTSLDASPAVDVVQFPYTFVHGTFELPNGTVIAELQNVELTINQNARLTSGHGSADAVGASRGKWEVTGKFNASMVNAVQLQRILDRTELATLRLKYTNGLAGANERSVTFNGTGVGVSEQVYSGQAVEDVFEDITWQVRQLNAVAINNTSVPPV